MEPLIARFYDSDRPCGAETRELAIGDRALRLTGLSEAHAAALERSWGPYFARSLGLPIHRTVEVVDAGAGVLLAEPVAGELYRVEPRTTSRGTVALSYAFALGALAADAPWRIALASDVAEPAPRSLENAARLLAARMAIELGGFAMHSAGVLRDGLAWLFAGPSGAGKSTAVGLSAPCVSLGDDFGIVLPGPSGWRTPPLPFDNAAAIVDRPDAPYYPVSGIWRLFHDTVHRIERPARLVETTSLLACTALPWAMPELSGKLLQQVGDYCSEGLFAHLHFAPDSGFWKPLRESIRS